MSAFASTRYRFAAFSLVGAIGFAVQLGALWLLTERAGFHYFASTIVATELAILLNFLGHESWTWSDRPAAAREVLRRLGRFHGANGLISLVGAGVVMPLLVGAGGVHYLMANAVTVGVCAIANFLAADRIVFAPAAAAAALVMCNLAGPGATTAEAADLKTQTIDAFNRYVKVTESRMDREASGDAPFLWMDRLTGAERDRVQTNVKRGDVVISRLQTLDGGREIDVPDGLVHHWVGTTFLSGVPSDRVVALMQDYDRYNEVYAPNVRASRLERRDRDRFTVYLQLFMKKVISVVLNTENDVVYRRLSQTRVVVRSYSTRIAEVRDAGTATQTEAPVGRDSGYLWRFNNYCSLEQRTEGGISGTHVQCETISLSRGIPIGLGWLVGPFVTSIPRESLEFTLSRMRATLTPGNPAARTSLQPTGPRARPIG